MSQSVTGIVHTQIEAENLVRLVKANGFTDDRISVLFPDKDGTKDFAHENSTKAPEGAVAGAGAGGALGGTLGLLAGIGALAIPGMGPLIAAGPIMAALSGAAVGAGVGGIGGALVGMGLPEYEAKMYEGKIRDGNILIAVSCVDGEEAKLAERLFRDIKASDIHRVGETSNKNK